MDRADTEGCDILSRRIEEVFAGQMASPLSVGLYLVATPIGNLADITLRALSVLHRVDVIYCEDTRHSAKLLNHFGISSRLKSYHEHNADKERGNLLALVEQGKRVALISDAGTPLVSDPGYKLVVEAHKRGINIVAIPGASAPITALVGAGLPTDSFTFAGFLPTKKTARRKRLLALSDYQTTLVFFDSPKRVQASLEDCAELYGDRPAAIARELTKLHETVITGSFSELAEQVRKGGTIKGEIVLLIGGARAEDKTPSDDELKKMLALEMQSGSLRDAVKSVCTTQDLPRSKVYNLAVEVKNSRKEETK